MTTDNHPHLPDTEWIQDDTGKWFLSPTQMTGVRTSKSQDRDAFFTKPQVAETCIERLISFLSDKGIQMADYTFIEPSAGSGRFFDAFKNPNKVAFDIQPMRDDITEQDFMTWQPVPETKYIAFGNPPFGVGGKFAECFFKRLGRVNCEFIAFILPMGFTGETIPKRLRKQGWYLHDSVELDSKSFTFENTGKDYKVSTAFCIFGRQFVPEAETFELPEGVKVHSIQKEDQPVNKKKGLEHIPNCGLFIQRHYTLGKPKEELMFEDAYAIKSPEIIGIEAPKEVCDWVRYECPLADISLTGTSQGGLVHIIRSKLENVIGRQFGDGVPLEDKDVSVKLVSFRSAKGRNAQIAIHGQPQAIVKLANCGDGKQWLYTEGYETLNDGTLVYCTADELERIKQIDFEPYAHRANDRLLSVSKAHITKALKENGFAVLVEPDGVEGQVVAVDEAENITPEVTRTLSCFRGGETGTTLKVDENGVDVTEEVFKEENLNTFTYGVDVGVDNGIYEQTYSPSDEYDPNDEL